MYKARGDFGYEVLRMEYVGVYPVVDLATLSLGIEIDRHLRFYCEYKGRCAL